MADDPRQETEIVLGGKTFRVRPSFTTIAAIEAASGSGCVPLGFRVGRADVTLSQLAIILAAMVLGQKGAPDADAIGELLMEDGMQPHLEPVSSFLLRALRGNKHHLDEGRKTQEGQKTAGDPPEAGSTSSTG
jgi:hypothetical protein